MGRGGNLKKLKGGEPQLFKILQKQKGVVNGGGKTIEENLKKKNTRRGRLKVGSGNGHMMTVWKDISAWVRGRRRSHIIPQERNSWKRRAKLATTSRKRKGGGDR